MFARARRALRLGYVTGRAIGHILVTTRRPQFWRPQFPGSASYCEDCNSIMTVDSTGAIIISAAKTPCPIHVAWRELTRAMLPPARIR